MASFCMYLQDKFKLIIVVVIIIIITVVIAIVVIVIEVTAIVVLWNVICRFCIFFDA